MNTIHDFLHSVINHLIPHDGNDYRPHLLQRGAVILMLVLILLSFLAANFQALLWQSSDWLVGAVLPAVVVNLTNTERAELTLATLARNPVLDAAATLKAEDMAKNSYFSHDSPTGVTPWHWFKEAGYPFVYAGENLAVYFTDSNEVVEAWMNSPTHRANIVGSQYREIGVGTARGTYDGFETVFVVQLFGTPALPPKPVAAATIAPATDVAVVIQATTTELALLASTSQVRTINEPQVAGEMTGSANSEETVGASSKKNEAAVASKPASKATEASYFTATATATTNLTSTTSEATTTEPQFVMNATEAIGLYSGMMASSTNLQPAPFLTTYEALAPIPTAAVLATEPNKLLQIIYLILGGITALVLLLSVLLEWRHHRPVQTAYGLLLLLIMAGLFYVHTTIVAGALVL